MRIRRWVISLGSRRQFPVLFVFAFYAALATVAFMLVYYIHASGNNRDSSYRRRRKTLGPEGAGVGADGESAPSFAYRVHHRGAEMEFESLLPETAAGNAQLRERVVLPEESWSEGNASVLLMWDVSFGQQNLRGCPDWNCVVTHDRSQLAVASAVFIASPGDGLKQQHPHQYFVHYSQESPLHSSSHRGRKHYYNMSFSYRSGTPAFSPYGYTAKLAESSRRPLATLMGELGSVVGRKSKAVAWFVSHCTTATRRELVVERLRKFDVPVDSYGGCGGKACDKADSGCWRLLDTDYHFYYAAENSLCEDYITEKLWNQGYFHLVVPIVLRRALVERFLPPNSFIAVDDFDSVRELAAHLRLLMATPEDYLKYFHWRTDYEVVPLDDKSDPTVERPYGFCQVCRLTRMQPPPTFVIENMEEWWGKVCDPTQSGLVDKVLKADNLDTADGLNATSAPPANKALKQQRV